MPVSMVSSSWKRYLNFFESKNKDIYFTEEYIRLYENEYNKAECFIYQDGEKYFLFPYLKRKIEYLDSDFYDFETAYGYGGPITNVKEGEFPKQACRAFFDFCYENNIVCGFVRFHPLLKNYLLFQFDNFSSNIFCDRKTVVINLELPLETIWNRELHSKHRNVIKKAETYGLKFIIDDKFENINDFIQNYNRLMASLEAEDFYFFDNSYFYNIEKNLTSNSFLGHIYLGDKIISSAIFFYYGIYGHYHLASSLREYLNYYPNNLLIYKTALYLKENGVKLFHLGGGTSGNSENGLYKFKKRFSSYVCDFYIGKIIFNKAVYRNICALWENKFPEKKEKYRNLLLKYRY